MNKLSNIYYKLNLIVDLLLARIINILSKFFKENTSSFILVYSKLKGEPWILNKIINDLKDNSRNPNNFKIYNSLMKLSLFKFLNGGKILSMHQSNIRYLEIAGFELNSISTYYTHSRLNQIGIKNIRKLRKIFCQNNYENSHLQSIGIKSNKIIDFPVGVHNNFLIENSMLKNVEERKYDILFSLRYLEKHNHYSIRKRYKFIIDLSNILSELGLKVAILGECWEKVGDGLNNKVDILNIEFKDYSSIYQNTKIYCNPSLVEGGPISLVEAFSSGCIILTTPVGLSFNLFDEDKMFYLMPFDADVIYWKNKILKILKIKLLRKTFLENMEKRLLKIQKSTFPYLASKLEDNLK